MAKKRKPRGQRPRPRGPAKSKLKAKAARKGKAASAASARKKAKTGSSRKASLRRRPTVKRTAASKKAASARKRAARKTVARKAAVRKAAVRKAAVRKSRTVAPTRKAAPRKAAAKRTAARAVTAAPRKAARQAPPVRPIERKAPSLDRARRVVLDDDVVLSPPSTLDMDRTASAARSGRRALHDRLEDHNETSPRLTAGDVDADWESAYSVGDEAPGGDNPTPDQDIVDDIGRALGNEYQDNEPLKGADKIAERDKHRWELDPGSKEDFDDRDDDL